MFTSHPLWQAGVEASPASTDPQFPVSLPRTIRRLASWFSLGNGKCDPPQLTVQLRNTHRSDGTITSMGWIMLVCLSLTFPSSTMNATPQF